MFSGKHFFCWIKAHTLETEIMLPWPPTLLLEAEFILKKNWDQGQRRHLAESDFKEKLKFGNRIFGVCWKLDDWQK